MPKELTLTNGNRIKVDNNDDIYVDFRDGNGYQYLCPARGTVSDGSYLQFRSFITEVMGIGDEVTGEKPKKAPSLKGQWEYLALREPEEGHPYVMEAPFCKQNGHGSVDSTTAMAQALESGAFSVYKKVAYVGAKPDTQREVITVG